MEPNDLEQQKSNGALVGSFIIVIIIIVGGLYLIKTKLNEIKQQKLTIEQMNRAVANSLYGTDGINNPPK